MNEARKIRPNTIRDAVGFLGLTLFAAGAWGQWGWQVACMTLGAALVALVVAGARGP